MDSIYMQAPKDQGYINQPSYHKSRINSETVVTKGRYNLQIFEEQSDLLTDYDTHSVSTFLSRFNHKFLASRIF